MQSFGQDLSLSGLHDSPAEKLAAKQFDVATIKPASADANGFRHFSLNIYPNGRVKITNFSLKNLICAAYNLGYWQVSGGAELDKDSYDIEAEAPQLKSESAEYNTQHDNWLLADPRLRAMLQALLENRFSLKTHYFAKPGWVFVLEKGNKPLLLVPATRPRLGGLGSVGVPYGGGNVLLNASMPELVAYLSGYVFHTTVIDKTGLAGLYDFRSKTAFSDEDIRSGGPELILPMIREMGLKLSRTRGSAVTLIVDSFSGPSQN